MSSRYPRASSICTALAALWWLGQGCSCTQPKIERSYPAPTAEQLVAHVQKSGADVRSYVAESVMDYWVGNQRIKATVYVMGERGAKVRFNAINPATDATAADLACNGQSFSFIDYERNCQLGGQCDRRAIGQLLRVSMEPDDFLLLAVGSAPIIPQPTGRVTWDEKRGAEVVELVSPDRAWRQTLVLDGRGGPGKWDVLESVVVDAQGALDWKLENKGFRELTGKDGRVVRVPDASHFEQPKQKADLQVRWKTRTLNSPLEASKFELTPPAGLARCGAKKPAAAAP
jgi:hypothetical protein